MTMEAHAIRDCKAPSLGAQPGRILSCQYVGVGASKGV